MFYVASSYKYIKNSSFNVKGTLLIILRLKGGLGNQIFQTVYALESSAKNEKIFVDTSHFYYRFADDYAGLQIGIDKLLKKSFSARLKFFKFNVPLNRIFWKVLNLLRLTNRRLGPLLILDGIFHEVDLFKHPLNYREYFNLESRSPVAGVDSKSVLIHVRKGDYTNSTNSQIYFNCDQEYFKNATQLILDRIPDARFYVMSNDNKWVRENFTFLNKYELLDIPDTLDSFKAMSQFSNFIISNSTFSWWAAFTASDSLTVAPGKWFINPQLNANLYPPSWIKV